MSSHQALEFPPWSPVPAFAFITPSVCNTYEDRPRADLATGLLIPPHHAYDKRDPDMRQTLATQPRQYHLPLDL
ncbi:hypothetical protein HGRIS_001116 [Hohenbuehelia grisea]|uniref:Uncharacterized protein n=1 Tax=Hohenbuehelia grisea TaxID=104357 RepID=A0ABR3JP22_9AGAR